MTRTLVWLAALAALAGCGDDFVGPTCVPDDAGKGCEDAGSNDGGRPNTAGTGAGDAASVGDANTAQAGTGGNEPGDEDAGDMPVPTDGGMDDAATNPDGGMDGGQTMEEPSDGTQLAPCEPGDQDGCADGLGCYQRGAGPGFCTAECEGDEDCAALTDATYTCSTTGGGQGGPGGGGMGLCRIECEGEDDTESCPEPLVCQSAGGGNGNGGGFRCGHPEDEQPQGSDDVPRWGPCAGSGDCEGDLVCYGVFQGGGAMGFCTNSCEGNDDCTAAAPSGDIDPTCGTQNQCRFDCTEGGTCPDDMECLQDRCVYTN